MKLLVTILFTLSVSCTRSKSQLTVINQCGKVVDTMIIVVTDDTVLIDQFSDTITFSFDAEYDSHYEIVTTSDAKRDTFNIGYVTHGMIFDDTVIVVEDSVIFK